ncbi:alpha/beta hydrolase [Neolewinella persica]|uniref:alpha/beta hydrolase n=1 Tax=Neolewinella persica TaxID=70998 RepID=UPI000373687C|nr:alpha/beta hydrolase-fold protein [Neolewinella persica]
MKYLVLLLCAICLFFSCPADKKKEAPRSSTALPNVTVVDQVFTIPGLDRERQIRVYVPPGYETSGKSYPVLYMHDGQNLFDDSTSFVGEWHVDEIMNRLAEDQVLELIVVGVDNGQGKRMNEMSPWVNEEYGAAEGEAYIDFIVEVVKPYVDGNYRTKSDRLNTGLLGSSMGGLISHYAVYQHPEVFGKAGIFSPSYWFSEEVFEFAEAKPVPEDTKLFLLVGEKESATMARDARQMVKRILATGHPSVNLNVIIDPEGTHNEGFWQGYLREAVIWLY